MVAISMNQPSGFLQALLQPPLLYSIFSTAVDVNIPTAGLNSAFYLNFYFQFWIFICALYNFPLTEKKIQEMFFRNVSQDER